MSSQFIKNTENFKCEKCETFVEGNGYTNHCPECLWSKHVDIFPGDRKNKCLGLMEPTGVKVKNKEYTIFHKCSVCGIEKLNKASPKDNFDMVVQISASK